MEISNLIKEKLQELKISNGGLIVLKGFDKEYIKDTLDMDKIIKDKFKYFNECIYNKKNIITYDEYLILSPLIDMQYNKIIVLENNMYINLVPLVTNISNAIKEKLLIHFDDEKEGEEYEIGDIREYVNVYSNFKVINNSYYVTYNDLLKSEKIEEKKLFDNLDQISVQVQTNYDEITGFDLNDEDDYIKLIQYMYKESSSRITIFNKMNYITNTFKNEKASIMERVFSNIDIIIVSKKQDLNIKNIRKDFKNILRNYWGHEDFRNIKVYDINSLEGNEKKIIEISQGEVIESIVSETEKCINGKDYRDIFVTAPTGAGKSIMFQIPAIYLSEKDENLLTIVISPLIGLMKDQVNNLNLINYKYARTINSDINPIKKQEIINDIMYNKCNILYISPETLLSRSNIEQLIGSRKLGLVVIDEAHIVTTWGKQFRPDYWYLGDHLNKLKKHQMESEEKGTGFVIATFTATSIYGGIENMYQETIESMKMINPITYLGYIKRDDLNINIKNQKAISNRSEYELNKFDDLIEQIEFAIAWDKKILIYFPTVSLINRFYEYCYIKGFKNKVSRYHGQLSGYDKDENFQKFLHKDTNVMLATKAFGMGIDIDDIEIVAHFAPTGNVCDYVQEIGRAARRSDLDGEAYYRFMSNDFKHINKLHGLSTIKKYQLVEVIKKVYDLYLISIGTNNKRRITKKRNELLVDAESFSYIFETPFTNQDDGINKVKTAMLLIQKDFERTLSFSPFHIRPIPMFEIGYFKISQFIQNELIKTYGRTFNEVDKDKNICAVNLKNIWESKFNYKYSFPQFKYLLYTKSSELDFEFINEVYPALMVDIEFSKNYLELYDRYINEIKAIINKSIRNEKYYSIQELSESIKEALNINIYKAKSITEILISSMSVYIRDFSKSTQGKVFNMKNLNNGESKYKFLNGCIGFFRWLDRIFNNVEKNTSQNKLYLVDEMGTNIFKEVIMGLGILETLELLSFKSIGGKNSQIYIYINQTKTLNEIKSQPWRYKNKLLETINERHLISVEMLTYLYEGKFTNDEIWNLIEDYFLGIIPEEVFNKYNKKLKNK